MKKKIKLSGVSETMLQTVYARAQESKHRGIIKDQEAEKIIDNLDYDFTMARKDSTMQNGVIARTIVLDNLVQEWLNTHHSGIVVNIACGLDTRCYRLNGYTHWYNLDLPEAIAIRKEFFKENEKISQIAMSAMDDWGSKVQETGVPVLVIVEGLTMYLLQSEVMQIFSIIAKRFESATIFVETMQPQVMKFVHEKSIEKSHAGFTWGIKNGQALANLLKGFAFRKEVSLAEGMAVCFPIFTVLKKIPVIRNISNRIVVLERI